MDYHMKLVGVLLKEITARLIPSTSDCVGQVGRSPQLRERHAFVDFAKARRRPCYDRYEGLRRDEGFFTKAVVADYPTIPALLTMPRPAMMSASLISSNDCFEYGGIILMLW